MGAWVKQWLAGEQMVRISQMMLQQTLDQRVHYLRYSHMIKVGTVAL